MLPQHLITILQDTPFYQKLCETWGRFHPLEKAPRTMLEELCKDIEEKIDAALEETPSLLQNKLVRTNGLSASTLEQLLDKKNPLDDKRQQKSVNALLVYLGIPQNRWEYYKKAQLTGSDATRHRLAGRWFIFRYHDDKLQRTLLRIRMNPDLTVKASYRSIQNFVFEDGEVILNDNYITIRLNNEAKTIDICAPALHYVLEDKIFNGLIRSIQQEPYATKCIIMSADKSKEDDSSIDKVHVVVHTSEKKETMQVLAEKEFDPIVVYLRKAYVKQGELRAPAFESPFIKSIHNPTTTAILDANDHYSAYQQILSEPWFSFSYGPEGFLVKRWIFTLDNILRKATVTCEQGALVHKGGVSFHPNHLSLTLNASAEDFIHTFVRKIDPKLEKTNLFALTSEASGHSMDAYRELFVPASTVGETVLPPIISHETFLNYAWLQPWEKCYLFDHRDVVHFATTPEDLKKRMSAIDGFFDKKYFALIPYFYAEQPAEQHALLLITLRINGVGEIEERFYLNAGDHTASLTPTICTGRLQLLNYGLWLSNNNHKGQKSEYLFITATNQSWFLQGITLSTDKHHRPCSDACIAIEQGHLPAGFQEKFEPGIIRRDTEPYEIFDKLVTDHTGISIDNYFFKLYPSIRWTPKDANAPAEYPQPPSADSSPHPPAPAPPYAPQSARQ